MLLLWQIDAMEMLSQVMGFMKNGIYDAYFNNVKIINVKNIDTMKPISNDIVTEIDDIAPENSE